MNRIKREGAMFVSLNAALSAYQILQMHFILEDYLVGTYVCLETGIIELTVHFDLAHLPKEPAGCTYSSKIISSFESYFEDNKTSGYVRTITYYFEYSRYRA
jgi:hypothetical protein